VLAALEHQDYPTLLLVKQLRPARDLSRAPLCQVMFVLDKPHRLAEQAVSTFVLGETGLRMNPGGLVLESFPLENRSATLDLAMLIMETAASLSVSIRYNTDLFDPATVARMAGHFEKILSHFVTQPHAKLSALKEILAEADRQQQVTSRQECRKANLQKLKTVKRKAVSGSRPSGNSGITSRT
jgi:non-ribosomal peptide synthetase component F